MQIQGVYRATLAAHIDHALVNNGLRASSSTIWETEGPFKFQVGHVVGRDFLLLRLVALVSKHPTPISPTIARLNLAFGHLILTTKNTTVPGAYEFYLQGLAHLQRYDKEDQVDLAVDMFRQAISEDSTYVLAYTGLAEAATRIGKHIG